MIEGMDRSLGDIVENLKQQNIWNNTIIIFMSDNGQHRNVPLNEPLRGHKLLPYEGGIRVSQMVDGESFVPYLEDTELRKKDRPLFWHFPHTYDQFPYSSVRKGDWKLVYRHLDLSLELYNLCTDLSETRNLAMEEIEIKSELASLLSNHLRATNAGMPVLTKNNKQVPYPDEVE
jgi:arylsulfatase A-like enzyme